MKNQLVLVLSYYLNHFHNAFFTIFTLLTVICFIFLFIVNFIFFLHFLQSLTWCEIEFLPPTRFELVSLTFRSPSHMHSEFKFRDLTIYQIFSNDYKLWCTESYRMQRLGQDGQRLFRTVMNVEFWQGWIAC